MNHVPINDVSRFHATLMPLLVAKTEALIASGRFVLGGEVEAFEREFAAYCGTSHCVGVANGTDALVIALRSLGVGTGDLVALTANAGMYATHAVLACNARPVFVDVDENGAMAPQMLAEVAARHPVRCIVVTHLYGKLAQIDEIGRIAARNGSRLIEDCAQAHGARRSGRMAGSWSDIATFSFYPTKNLGALGDAGAVTTDDPALFSKAVRLRQYGWSGKYRVDIRGGQNSRLDELQAAYLRLFLPYVESRNDRRRTIAKAYRRGISHPAIRLPSPPHSDDVCHLYVVRSRWRESLAAHLRSRGIATDIHYPVPDHKQPAWQDEWRDVSLPATERDAGEVLTLPCFPEMREDECDAVIRACNEWGQS